MRSRRIQNKLTRGLRGGLLSAASLSFVIGAVGVPLPVGPVKDRSVAFPCMDRSCGCHDAADCKKHCCCFSSEEKLAWSAEHGVDPTPFVDDEALAALLSRSSQGQSCSAHPWDMVAGSQPRCEKNNASRSCCAKKGARQASGLAANRAGQQPAGDQTRGLLTITAYRQCTGLASLWTLVHAALPPPNPVQCEFQWLATGRVAQASCLLASVRFAPPTPPPRA